MPSLPRPIRCLSLLLALAAAVFPAYGATITSQVTGNWDNAGTWSSGVPTANDDVFIAGSDVVTVNTVNATAKSVTVYGTLKFSTVVNSSLTVTGGDVIVASSGSLTMGIPGESVGVNLHADLVLAYGSSPGQYGLIVQDGGDFQTYGAVREPFAYLSETITGARNQVKVPSADSNQWRIGDTIVVGPTSGSGTGTSEEAEITGVSYGTPNVFDISPALGADRFVFPGFRIVVANLTRNVTIRSSSTYAEGQVAYVRNLTSYTTSFAPAYTGFFFLGENSAGKYGLAFDGTAARGIVSSCSFRQGYDGFFAENVSSSTLVGNIFYKNADRGVRLVNASSFSIRGNAALENTGAGFDLSGETGSFDNFFSSNAAASNGGAGFSFSGSTGTRGEYNLAATNAADGFLGWPVTRGLFLGNFAFNNALNGYRWTGCSGGSFRDNGAYGSGGHGFHLPGCTDAIFRHNGSILNTGSGFRLESSHRGSWIANFAVGQSVNFDIVSSSALFMAHDVSTNGGTGFSFSGCNDPVLAGLRTYGNTAYGLRLSASTGVVLADAGLGYDEANGAAADLTAELSLTGAAPVDVTLLHARVNPSPGLDLSGLALAGARVASFHQDFDTGTVRVWGDYRVAGATLTLDYATRLYAATATAARLMRGAGHAAAFDQVYDADALTQMISVEYRGGQWHVDGSSSGPDMVAPFAGTTSDLDVPGLSPHFRMDFTAGGSPEEGDRLDFIVIGTLADASQQKKLLVGPAAAPFNQGKSRIVVEPDGGVVLLGAPGYPTLLDRLNGSSTYYTFIDSGAFTAHYASMTNMDSSGLQLSGSAGVDLATSTFDFFGIAAATNSYLTLRDLTSAATFYGLVFDASRDPDLAPFARNLVVEGSDGGLDWILRRWSGGMGGEEVDGAARESDPNGKVRWAPFQPNAASVPLASVLETSAAASWTENGNAAGVYYNLETSTDAAFGGTVLSSMTQALSGTLLGMDRNTTYYFRVSAVDVATSSFRSLGSTITLAAAPSVLADPFLNLQATNIQAAWAAFLASPSSSSASGYRLEASSTGFPGTSVLHSSATAEISLSTLTVGLAAAMDANTTYYFRAASINQGGRLNFTILGTTATLAVAPQANGDPFLWVSGASVTARWAAMPLAPPSVSADGFLLQASTSSVFGGILYSSRTDSVAVSTLTLTGLGGFVTYYFRVGSLNRNGVPNFTVLGSTLAPRQYTRISETNNLLASTDLAWGDYDNDGDPDIAVANEGGGDLYLMRNNGNGTFTALMQTGSAGDSRSLDWGDYDGDGDLDIAVANETGEDAYLLRNDAGSFTKVVITGSGGNSRGIAFGDFDGDGDLDLGVANSGNQDAYLLRNDGADVFTRLVQAGSFGDSRAVAWGDMDGDGDLDLVVANAGTENTQVLRNIGTESLEPYAIPGSGGDSRAVALGDYDGDGDLDIAVANGGGEDTYIIRNDGGSGFSKVTQTGSGGDSYDLAWADQDNDGDLDLLVVNATGEPAYLLINNGSDVFARASQADMDGKSRAVAWADYDADGDLDAAVANYSGEDIFYLRNDLDRANQRPDRPAFTPEFVLDYQGSTTALTVKWDPGDYDNNGDTKTVVYALAVAAVPMSLSADERRIVSPSDFRLSWNRPPLLPGQHARPPYQLWPGDGTPKQGVALRVDFPNGTQGNLKSDATYYFRIQAVDRGTARSSWSVEASTFIYTPIPLGPTAVYEAFESSLSVTISTTRASRYFVDASTAADFTTYQSSSGVLDAGTVLTVSSLEVNTTYFLRVGALWQTSTTYGTVAPASTATLAVTPAAPVSTFTAVHITSMTVAWDEGANPVDHTTYTVTLSTSATFPNSDAGNVVFSTAPAGTVPTGTLNGLIPNTTYHVFVAAVNHNGIVSPYRHYWSTPTRSAPPVGASYSFVGLSSITLSWGGGGNPLGLTTYTVVLTSGPAWPNSYSGNASTTVVLAGGVMGSTFTGLNGNTTYYAFGWTRNHQGFVSETALLGSTATLARSVAPLSPAFTEVWESSMSVFWGNGGNPVDLATYTVVLSTGPVLMVLSYWILTVVAVDAAFPVSSRLKAVVAVNEGRELSDTISALESPVGAEERFSLALALSRRGEDAGALALYEGIDSGWPLFERALNNMGACHYRMGELNSAIARFEAALGSGLPTVQYNLSQAYRDALRFDDGEALFRRLQSEFPEKVVRFMANKGDVVDERLPLPALWGAALRSEAVVPWRTALWRALAGILSIHIGPGLGMLFLVLFWFIESRPVTGARACRCRKCGVVYSGVQITRGDICNPCYMGALRVDQTAPRDRIARILEKQKYYDRRVVIARILAAVPGLASYYLGRWVSGFVLTGLFSATIVVLLWGDLIFQGSFTFPLDEIRLAGALLLAVLLLVSGNSVRRGSLKIWL